MKKVISICKPIINDDAIRLLETTLERVKSGELTSVGISWVTKDGEISGEASEGTDGILLWASLEHNAKSFYNNILLNED